MKVWSLSAIIMVAVYVLYRLSFCGMMPQAVLQARPYTSKEIGSPNKVYPLTYRMNYGAVICKEVSSLLDHTANVASVINKANL